MNFIKARDGAGIVIFLIQDNDRVKWSYNGKEFSDGNLPLRLVTDLIKQYKYKILDLDVEI